ncbi:MAG TPA: class I SAM-dependent methyltransferase [Puia sp.]|jgi:predicted O-methyltransferase YrrM
MHSRLRLAQKYLHYYRTASNGRGHGIHSPFVFDFVVRVLNADGLFPEYASIERLRRRLKQDNTLLEIEDMGAGSAMGAAIRNRRIADIARQAAKPPKWGQLLLRIARHYQPATILELGTSLGLSTAYLAMGAPGARVHTIEGAPAIADIAAQNFRSLGLENIYASTGNFDEVLAPLLQRTGPVDLAFIDGNHRRDPTLYYFNMLVEHGSPSSVLIFDDIHWSVEMEEAWAAIREDPRVYLTIDLFFIGLVFRREEFKVKQDFTIRY